MSRGGDLACKVYIGDLNPDATEKELEREFEYYGKLKSVWVARNPPGFAFVEFEDPRDADDAIVGLDGKTVCGNRVRVEKSSGKRKTKPWERDNRGGYGGRDRGFPSRYGDQRSNGRAFDANDAYDGRSGGGARRGRSRSRSRDRYRGGRSSRSGSRDRTSGRERSGSRGRY